MCGLVCVSARRDSAPDVSAAVGALAHRGPDGRGEYYSPRRDCSLGHVRLSIFDISPAGSQPMWDSTGRFVIVYNGEVFNWRELRHELESEHGPIPWRSETDTELIVEGFARGGETFFERLNGMFAFAIYDVREERVFVLRDPMGIKPLFLSMQRGAVAVASELCALRALPGYEFTLDPSAFAAQLAFTFIPEPATPYSESRKVEPGVLLRIEHGQIVSSRALFETLRRPEKSLASEPDAVDELDRLLNRAVARQLRADVPVGLFLSGGLDSSLVAALAARSGNQIRRAYTLSTSAFDLSRDEQEDELSGARATAEAFGLTLVDVRASSDFLADLPSVVRCLEDGISDPAALASYVLARHAREDGVPVVLTGQGADELFSGYRRSVVEQFIAPLPGPVRSVLGGALRAGVATLPRGRFNGHRRRVSRLARLCSLDDDRRLLDLYTWASVDHVRSLCLGAGNDLWVNEFLKRAQFRPIEDSRLGLVRALDFDYDLLSLNLAYCDRTTMASGVEARVPFLDFDVVRFARVVHVRERNASVRCLRRRIHSRTLRCDELVCR